MTTSLKNLVPRALKESIKQVHQRRIMHQALKEAVHLKGSQPSIELVSRFARGWGDDGFRAVGGYLQEVANRAVATNGHILEIGSGLTIILMAALTLNTRVEIWTLEHSEAFYERTQSWLESRHLTNVHLFHSPLQNYGEFVWYTPPLALMPAEFELVVADGPPGDTKGGRYGLLPIMKEKIRAATILLDDAERIRERETMLRWQNEFGLINTVVESNGKAFGICTF